MHNIDIWKREEKFECQLHMAAMFEYIRNKHNLVLFNVCARLPINGG